jgi:Na+/proline symporter
MSNLSGSLNSLASTTALDLYKPLIAPNASDESLLRFSRWLTAAWGVVLILIAIVSRRVGSVFTAGLTIASLVYGPLLGAFLLGIVTKRANQRGVISGMSASLIVMILIWAAAWAAANLPDARQIMPLSIAWTWYVLIGTIICFTVGYAVSLMSPVKATEKSEALSK